MSHRKKSLAITLTLSYFLSIFWFAGWANAESNPPAYAIEIDRTSFIPLVDVCTHQSIALEWDGVTEKATLKKNGQYVIFMAGTPLVNVDGAIRSLASPPRIMRGIFLIPEVVPGSAWWPWKIEEEEAPLPDERVQKTIRVLIDPGHGGEDAGESGLAGFFEKDIVLEFSLELGAELRAAGFDIFLTRTTDEAVSIRDRQEMIVAEKADLFFSVHAGASPNDSTHGFETYYFSPSADDYARSVAEKENNMDGSGSFDVAEQNPLIDPTAWEMMRSKRQSESILLAKLVSKGLAESALTMDRGVRGAGLNILKNVQVPALFIRIGFMTHSEEASRLKDPAYRKTVVLAITQAFFEYKEFRQSAHSLQK